jgi:hypothetical protein
MNRKHRPHAYSPAGNLLPPDVLIKILENDMIHLEERVGRIEKLVWAGNCGVIAVLVSVILQMLGMGL